MVRLNWRGGEHEFALKLGQLRALQDKCNAGPEEVFNRIRLGNWKVDDLLHTLRLGLIGSGAMPDGDAGRMVSALFDAHPIIEFKLTALAVLSDALLGSGDDPVGEAEGGAAPPKNGGSQPSTEAAQ